MRVLVVLVAAASVAVLVLGVINEDPAEPQLRLDDSVATDFGEVAEETWDRFLAAFPARLDCIGEITLVAEYDLDDRAKYDSSRAQMAVRVPGPRVLLERAVVHELAHHVEFSCEAHETVRPAFLSASRRDVDSPWFEGSAWGDIPSEVFAEAVVEVVFEDFGKMHTGIGLIPAEAVEVVRTWGTSK